MTTYMNIPNPQKISEVSVATTISGTERILGIRVSNAAIKTISIPVILLKTYVNT